MGRLIKIQDVDQFSDVLRIPEKAVSDAILASVRRLHEKNELEPALREILYDPTETPHGPTEIADILTTKVRVRGYKKVAAFILKGRSFSRVRSVDIAHQILRIRQMPDTGLMVLVAVGHIQDDAQRDFVQGALDTGCDYLVVDAQDCARLLLAYEKICPTDGTPYGDDGICQQGHLQDAGVRLEVCVREDIGFEIPRLRDVSHGAAKRYSAVLLVDRHYSKEVLREIILKATQQIRQSNYHRNQRAADRWRGQAAHVVWLFIARDLEDIRHSNWVCRTEWIDPNLNPAFRPLCMKGHEQVEDIQVSWNDSYEEMKSFFAHHTAEKGEVLEKLEPLIGRAVEIGRQISNWFDRFQSGTLSEEALIELIQKASPEISRIYSASGNLPMPPQDLEDYKEVCQSIFAHVDNMRLYFSNEGLAQWPSKNRLALLQMSLGGFARDTRRLQFEKEKVN
jgi:hypothetical protein